MSLLVQCPYCNQSFKERGLHIHVQRKHEGKQINYNSPNKGKTFPAEIRIKFGNGRRGKIGIFKHTEETKRIISEHGLKSNHRRLIKSVRPYMTKDGLTVMLDSSWEEIVAKRLDFLDVKWYRPPSMKWVDKTGKERNYFPDFYLPDYDLYLDPKNPFAVKVQSEKVDYIESNYSNVVFLRTEEECSNFRPW